MDNSSLTHLVHTTGKGETVCRFFFPFPSFPCLVLLLFVRLVFVFFIFILSLSLPLRSVFDGPIWVVCICCIWFDVYVPSFSFQLVFGALVLFSCSLFLSNHSIFSMFLSLPPRQDNQGQDGTGQGQGQETPWILTWIFLSSIAFPPHPHCSTTLFAHLPFWLKKKKNHIAMVNMHSNKMDGVLLFFCISKQKQTTTITPWLQFATAFILCSLGV